MRTANFLSVFLILFFCVVGASAHPLGNFSVNQFSRLEVNKSKINLRQILDLAEIPTFQESSKIDLNRDGTLDQTELDAYADRTEADYAANLHLTVNQQELALRPVSKLITLPPGAGSLPTLRLEWNFEADLPAAASEVQTVSFVNSNNSERVGWNEIVLARASGVQIFNSNVYGSNLSNELHSYPDNMLMAPLRDFRAEFSFVNTAAALPVNARLLADRDGKTTAVSSTSSDRLAELINVPQITLPIALFGLLIAFGLGALHALSPGHGKTVVGAYLVGSRGTIKHAAFLGLTVTVTHTIGVFVLGLITLFAAKFILPERIMPILNFVSGLIVLIIGLSLFKNRLFSAFGWQKNNLSRDASTDHLHDDSVEQNGFVHSHNGGAPHSHLPPARVTWRSLLLLGISGGLLPCPSALVLMLSAISFGRIGYGLILTLAFSFGLAATLMTIGLIFLSVGKIFESPSLSGNSLVKTIPIFSAFVIACLGAIICVTSLS